jgi:antirestriction protein ArdC
MAMKAQNPELWAAQRILDLLEQGGLPPWRKPWASAGCLPQNMTSRREYNGLNRWMLMMAPYGNPFYLTIKQINKLGGKIIKGEKPWPVFFWQRIEKEDGTKRSYLFCRGYKVWNIEQCEDIPEDKIPNLEVETHDHDPIEACEAVVAGYKGAPPVLADIARCYYAPLTDKVGMVPKEQFKTAEEYYASLFHEYAHSTGHASRLERESLGSIAGRGSHEYSQEELVAEFCAAMLCAQAGIDQAVVENQAAYIAGWHKRLKGDPEALVFASRDANKAFNHILGKKYNDE